MNVHEYILQDRQWPRLLRISHAKMQLAKAVTPNDKSFWLQVLKANTVSAE